MVKWCPEGRWRGSTGKGGLSGRVPSRFCPEANRRPVVWGGPMFTTCSPSTYPVIILYGNVWCEAEMVLRAAVMVACMCWWKRPTLASCLCAAVLMCSCQQESPGRLVPTVRACGVPVFV